MPIKKILFCLLTLMVLTAGAQVRPTIQWVNSVSQDATISGISTGLDGNSNVHSAGRIYFAPGNADIIVQCTDSTGAVLWTYTYDNGGYDCPKKIRVHGANTYITGVSWDSGTGLDYITIQIDNTGNATWISRFDRGFNMDDEANDLCIDSNLDVYVTGKSKNSGGNDDAFTLKLDGNTGNPLWQNAYNPNNLNDEGICLVLANNQADVIVGSNATDASTGVDIVAFQINAATGANGWVRKINGSNNSNDRCSGIILAGGNVVLCGMVDNSGTGNDYTTVKVDATGGSVIFQRDYNASASDEATSLVRDSSGNIAVTGIAFNSSSGFYEYHTNLYDSTGSGVWLHKKYVKINSINVNPSIVCDTIAHHFYIAGEEENSDRDVLVYQLTPGGNLGWEKSYSSAFSGSDGATSLVVNGIGVVFVSASTVNSGGLFDITTIKIVQTPVYFPPDYGTQELQDPRFVFQKNDGQLLNSTATPVSESEVGYYNQGRSPASYFNAGRFSYILTDRDTILDSLHRVDVKILGANSHAEIFHYEPIEAKKHYFISSSQGIADVRSYKRLFIPEVYPNVDLHHYSNTSGLKSYFVFKTPGEAMADLRLKVEGATSSTVDTGGNLIATTGLGDVNIGMLTAYQATFNVITQTFVLMPLTVSWNNQGSGIYSFNISGYSPFWPVVVYVSKPGATSAPTSAPNGNLWWSTFIGDVGTEEITSSRVDKRDNYYTCGLTSSIFYPVAGPFQAAPPTNNAGARFGVLSKFDKFGKLDYSTYYGGPTGACGTAFNKIHDVTVDSLYYIYFVGSTTSNTIATLTNTVSGSLNDMTNSATTGQCQNAFVVKLNPAGNVMRFGSYYGGTTSENFNVVKYVNGQIHIGGYSASTLTLPSPQPNTFFQTTGNGVYLHLDTAGVIKHNTKVAAPISGGDVDSNGNFYTIGTSNSFTIPVYAPAASYFTQTYSTGVVWVFQRFSPADSLTWSTYVCKSGANYPTGICIKDSVIGLCGWGSSTTFTTVINSPDSGDVAPLHNQNIQLMKLNRKNGSILWSAYHATNDAAVANAVGVDKDYNLFVTGRIICPSSGTCSGQNIRPVPATGYYQQNNKFGSDAFLVGYNSQNQRIWTTYFGSLNSGPPSLFDGAYALAVNNSGKLFIAGGTEVKNNSLPLVRWNNVCYYDSVVADPANSAVWDCFISMFDITEFKIVGISEVHKSSLTENITLFPNPNNGNFTLRFKGASYEKVNISVINVLGQKVYSMENLKVEKEDINLDLGRLTRGVYFVNISDKGGSGTIKFIIN